MISARSNSSPHTLTRRHFLKLSAASAAALGPQLRLLAAQPRSTVQPWNILFFLADDMGWHDIAPYGNEIIDTPNLAKFASESMRFTDAYAAAPVCSPTRASIMTGRYPARLQLTDWIPGYEALPHAKLITPAFKQELPSVPTIANMFHSRGYWSESIGKWHLGGQGHLPTDYGFDENIAGSDAGSPKNYFGPESFPNLELAPGEFLTERLTKEGTKFLARKETPYFLYQSHYTVHTPLEAPRELVAKYEARYTGDLDPTYCAMVETLDTSFGQIMAALDQSGERENTIVFFFSDNGGLKLQGKRPKPITDNTPLRAGKGFLYEGGIREPLMVRWPGKIKPGSICRVPVCSVDFLPTFAEMVGSSAPSGDGISICPLLTGGVFPERPLFWHYPHYHGAGGTPSGAIREGEWKLIEFFEDGRLELFHLWQDIEEQRNMIEREPNRAAQMHAKLVAWRESVKASMPKENPAYDAKLGDRGLSGIERPTPPF